MMQTRCPACATVFRVTPEQLKLRQGQVRCGKCQQVFDAFAALAATAVIEPAPQHSQHTPSEVDVELAQKTTEPAADQTLTTPEVEPDAASSEPALADEANPPQAFFTEPETEKAPAPLPAAQVEQPPESVAESTEPKVEPQPEPQSAPVAAPATEQPHTSHTSLLHDDVTRTAAANPWSWLLASLVAVLLLSFQLLMHFRSEAVVLAPELKPALQMACAALGCDVSLPRQPEQLSIEMSDLHPDKQNPAQLVLTATLQNRAPFAQQLPHLELTLTDAYDQPLLRKAIAPDEYLPPAGQQPRPDGFAPRSELDVRLILQPDSSIAGSAAGYRLYLFYP